MSRQGDGQTDQTLVYGEPDRPTDGTEGADELVTNQIQIEVVNAKNM